MLYVKLLEINLLSRGERLNREIIGQVVLDRELSHKVKSDSPFLGRV